MYREPDALKKLMQAVLLLKKDACWCKGKISKTTISICSFLNCMNTVPLIGTKTACLN